MKSLRTNYLDRYVAHVPLTQTTKPLELVWTQHTYSLPQELYTITVREEGARKLVSFWVTVRIKYFILTPLFLINFWGILWPLPFHSLCINSPLSLTISPNSISNLGSRILKHASQCDRRKCQSKHWKLRRSANEPDKWWHRDIEYVAIWDTAIKNEAYLALCSR